LRWGDKSGCSGRQRNRQFIAIERLDARVFVALLVERFAHHVQRHTGAGLLHVPEWGRVRVHNKRSDRVSWVRAEHWRDLPRPVRDD
jgi:hypothetical protein